MNIASGVEKNPSQCNFGIMHVPVVDGWWWCCTGWLLIVATKALALQNEIIKTESSVSPLHCSCTDSYFGAGIKFKSDGYRGG